MDGKKQEFLRKLLCESKLDATQRRYSLLFIYFETGFLYIVLIM